MKEGMLHQILFRKKLVQTRQELLQKHAERPRSSRSVRGPEQIPMVAFALIHMDRIFNFPVQPQMREFEIFDSVPLCQLDKARHRRPIEFITSWRTRLDA